MPYAIPNVHVDYALTDTGIPVGFWRSVNNSFNAFAVETFIDELAAAAKQDPVAYRRALLTKAPRHLAVVELAASKAGWGTPPPAGRARGIAVHKAFDSYVAEVAEVSVKDGAVRVHRVVAAVDCGIAVAPNTLTYNIEGAIVYGLTAAMKGKITIERVDHPVAEHPDLPGAVDVVAIGIGIASLVQPVPAPTFSIMRRSQQPVHQSLIGIGSPIRQKLAHFSRGWR